MELWNNIMTAWAEGEDAVSILEKTADLTDAIQDRLPFAFGGSAKKRNYSSHQQVLSILLLSIDRLSSIRQMSGLCSNSGVSAVL
jgi:hypothetical protein